MSLPLTRRIAQAALLVAAGATPLIAAGSASAHELLPQGTDATAGISKLDGLTPTSTLKGEAQNAGQALGTTTATALGTAAPAAAHTTAATAAAVPQTAKVVDALQQRPGATTSTLGSLTDPVGTVAQSAPLGGTTRSLPLADSAALPQAAQLGHVLGSAPLGDAAGTVGHLTESVPAADRLTGSLPATNRLTALPATDNLPGALSAHELAGLLPATPHVTDSLPATQHLADSLPAAHHLADSLPTGERLTDGLHGAGDLTHAARAADALHLDELSSVPGATHRLSDLPALGGATGSLGGVATSMQHPVSVS